MTLLTKCFHSVNTRWTIEGCKPSQNNREEILFKESLELVEMLLSPWPCSSSFSSNWLQCKHVTAMMYLHWEIRFDFHKHRSQSNIATVHILYTKLANIWEGEIICKFVIFCLFLIFLKGYRWQRELLSPV